MVDKSYQLVASLKSCLINDDLEKSMPFTLLYQICVILNNSVLHTNIQTYCVHATVLSLTIAH